MGLFLRSGTQYRSTSQANWENVLEDKMQPVNMALMAMQEQIIDLQKEIKAMKEKDRNRLVILIIFVILLVISKAVMG